MEISTGKKLKSRRKKIGKSDMAPPPPPEKFPCYAPGGDGGDGCGGVGG